MAAVTAELKFRNGMREKINVQVENNLSSVISGIHELNANVSRILSELVQREKDRGDGAGEEEEEDSDEDDGDEDDEESDGPQNSELQPPAKRSKT